MKSLLQPDFTCTICGTRRTVTQNHSNKKSRILWCFKCRANREFIDREISRADEFLVVDRRSSPIKEINEAPRNLNSLQGF